jgi:hypothetical protein
MLSSYLTYCAQIIYLSKAPAVPRKKRLCGSRVSVNIMCYLVISILIGPLKKVTNNCGGVYDAETFNRYYSGYGYFSVFPSPVVRYIGRYSGKKRRFCKILINTWKVEDFHIYLCFGQSNMGGLAWNENGTANYSGRVPDLYKQNIPGNFRVMASADTNKLRVGSGGSVR